MTTPDPAALITRAKQLATLVVCHLAADVPLGPLLGDCPWELMGALVTVLGECADREKLKAVVGVSEDGEPVPPEMAAKEAAA